MTLEESNILWLRGRAHAGKERSLSEALDRLVTSARESGYGAEVRSVVGTVDLPPDDPDLRKADAVIRNMMDASIRRRAGRLTTTPASRRRRPRARKAGPRG